MLMTRGEAAGYRARWARVNAAERAALRRMSIAQRLERLSALMMSASAFGGARRLRAEDAAVRARWARIRRARRG
jgi:hypothetical protein